MVEKFYIFGEGDTRTTAVFFIKYLRVLGFDVTNDIFAENAWYFRNALVRANYNDLKNGDERNIEFDYRNDADNKQPECISFLSQGYTNTFDGCPVSAIQLQNLDMNARLPMKDENNFRFLTYDDIDHKDIMRFYVKECVDDKEIRKQLFNVLRSIDYVSAFLEKLHELNLYDEFEMICGDIYEQLFFEWAKKNGLDF